MNKRREPFFLPLFLAAILHAAVFAALSLEYLWPVAVSARKPISVRILPDALPKPKEVLPPDPESRFLSDANRRESGKGPEKTGKPRLRREEEDLLPARRGAPKMKAPPKLASLPPPPAPKAAPPVPKAPPPTPKLKPKPKVQKPVPKKPPEKKEAAKKPVKAVQKKKPAPPEKIKSPKKNPAPVVKKKAVQKKIVQKKKEPPEKKPKKKPKKKKVERKEKIKLASLPPRPKPAPAVPRPKPAPKAPQKDPLALFRPRPQGSGQPKAPDLRLTDEEAARIAKASRTRDLKKEEEEGDVVSLDTRNFKYVSYFAHIKRKIQAAWGWPQEARNFSGRLTLKFVLREDGTLSRVELLSSSGYRILDDEALSAVTKAAPFRPFPPGFGRKFLPIEGNFIYEQRRRGIGG